MKKSRRYFQEKVRIDKKQNQSTAHKIQLYNDWLVDELVRKTNEGEVNVKPGYSMLYAELAILNKPDVYKNYQRIINSPYTSDDVLFKMITQNKANKNLEQIVEAEIDRITKNLDYAEEVLRKYDVPQNQYQKLIKEQEAKSVGRRQQILKEVAIKNNDLLVSDGLNIPSNVFTYKNIEATAENLLRQSQMTSRHEEVNSINDFYISQGKDKIYNGKEWVWTGRGKTTRHRSNHLQKRALNEPFIITNDKTLAVDDMMYPSDPAGSFSNAFICYCECEYLTDYDDPYADSLPFRQTVYTPATPVKNLLESPVNFQPTPKPKTVTFAPHLIQTDKPVSVSLPAGGNVTEAMQINVGTPVNTYIDTDIDGINDVPYNYLIDGNKLDIIYSDGNYYYNGLQLNDYDPETKTGKISKTAVNKHNENNPATVNTGDVLTGAEKLDAYIESQEAETVNIQMEPINSDELIPMENQDKYMIDGAIVDVKKDPLTGNYTYNGFIIEDYDPSYEIGTITDEQVVEHNKQLGILPPEPKPKPVNELIDTDTLVLSNNGKNYLFHKLDLNTGKITEVDGKYYYKGFELTEHPNNLLTLPVQTIEEHNKQFANGDDNTNAPATSNKTGEYIDHDDIKYYFFDDEGENGQYWLDEGEGAYLNENGEWEYNGLVADKSKTTYGIFDLKSVEEHNKQFVNAQPTITEPDTQTNLAKEYIDPNDLIETSGNYLINLSLGNKNNDYITQIGDKYYYKGLEVKMKFKDGQPFYAKVTQQKVQEHNAQFTGDTTNNDNNQTGTDNNSTTTPIIKTPIQASEIPEFDGEYFIQSFMVEEINGEYYYHGLKVTPNGEGGFTTTYDEIYKHNSEIDDTPMVNNSKLLRRIEDENKDIYAVEEDGTKYRIDKKAKSEKEQDRLQNQIDMSEHKDEMHGWALPRYNEINSLVLGIKGDKSNFDGRPYKEFMQNEVFPLLDKIYELVDETKSTDTPEYKRLCDEYEKLVDKAHEIDDSHYNQKQLKKLMWDLVGMESALAKSPALHENVMFIRDGHWELEWNEVGGIFEFVPYSSTTYKEGGAGFGSGKRYKITILAPEGTRGTRMNRQYNSLTGEREWLLKRHQKFEVLEFDEENSTCTIRLIPD